MNFQKIKIIVILLYILASFSSCSEDEPIIPDVTTPPVYSINFPFPNHTNYLGTHIKPSNFSQTELDNQVTSFYDQWKVKYLKNDCNSSEYYVRFSTNAKTVSEAHGYGMIITAFMAGYDVEAKKYFDGLYKYYKSNPSITNSYLMDWKQINCNDPLSPSDGSATDGDLDIAFSLLLAHKQWESAGSINYLQEAKLIIAAIMQSEINQQTWTIKLGDWVNSSSQTFFYSTRTSDFTTSHLRVFKDATANANWDLVLNKCYDLISIMQNNHSPNTGLPPDFIIDTNTTPIPAYANFLESDYDGDYYYNACRFPWRIGTDFLVSGDIRAKDALNKINSWLTSYTSGNVNTISNGFLLDGTAIFSWSDVVYKAPFAVGAMADTSNQAWLNTLYSNVINTSINSSGYYENTVKLLSMISVSGNYWNPEI
ncbi:MAG: glycosyl hydrolase family 8 [Flavobacteriaceae bacterium]